MVEATSMYGTFPRFRFRVVILACVTSAIGWLGVPARCAEPSPTKQPAPPRDNRQGPSKTNKSPMVWDGAEVRQIEKDWSAMTVPPDTMVGDTQLVRFRQLTSLLEKRLPKQEIPGLIASLGKVPIDEEKQTEFQRMFIRALELILIEGGERENLVALFSTHFDDYYLGGTTEYILVARGEKMKDPILVLAEAYQRSKDPVIRQRIATSVHQSFDGVGVKGKDDAEFIANAMKWYKENKTRVVLNHRHDVGGTMVHSWTEFPLYYIDPEKKQK
jgi:hypothetical protein